MERISYELKYCERCGALGLRRSRTEGAYCDACAQVLTHYASPATAAPVLLRSLRKESVRQPVLRFELQPAGTCARVQ